MEGEKYMMHHCYTADTDAPAEDPHQHGAHMHPPPPPFGYGWGYYGPQHPHGFGYHGYPPQTAYHPPHPPFHPPPPHVFDMEHGEVGARGGFGFGRGRGMFGRRGRGLARGIGPMGMGRCSGESGTVTREQRIKRHTMQAFSQSSGTLKWDFTDPARKGTEAEQKIERPFVVKCFTFAIPKEDLTVTVMENVLHISGKHGDKESGSYIEFERKYHLPDGVEASKLKTRLRCGMLVVKEENAPMEIPVVVAGDDDDDDDHDSDDGGDNAEEFEITDGHEKK